MPNIPTVALSEVPTAPALGPRASVDAFNAPNRAITAAGGALQDVGGMLGRFAMQKQDQVNRGLLAGEEAVRMQTAAQIEEHVRNNPDKPETWGKFADATWRGYERAKSSRAKAQGWGPAVIAQDKLIDQGYRAEFGVKFAAEVDKGLIRQSNARLESLATMQLAEGNVGAALASVDAMTLYPEQRQAKVEALTNGAVYGQYDREMSDISTMPPAEQVKALAMIEAELVAVDKAGKPVNGWVEDDDGKRVGGLNHAARTDLVRAARARIKAADVAMAQSGRALVRQAELGADPAQAFSKALAAGEITEDVARIFVPEVNAALAAKQAEADAKAEKEAERLGIRRDRAEAAAQRMIDARGGATLTMDEIERREARGITRPNDPTGLAADSAARLREQLQAREDADRYEPDFLAVDKALNERLGESIFWQRIGDNAQMSPREKRKVLEDINAAKVSVGAKLKLMDKFFEVVKWDLREGEISDIDGDRNIGSEEKELRTSMIEYYRSAGAELGPRALGARYMSDMARVSTWFAANENASPAAKQAKAREFYETTRKAVSDEASTAILRTIPIFQ
jgi:hypothetical protein